MNVYRLLLAKAFPSPLSVIRLPGPTGLAFLVGLSFAQNARAQNLRFEDATARAGVAVPADPNGYGHGVAVADYNNDGLPDIYVVAYDADNSLFLNNGDGTFTDFATQAKVRTGSRFDRGIAAADYDNDGDVDFYVAAGAGHNNLLYVNDGNGAFFDFASEAGVRLNNFQGQGVAWGDYDNDGDLDLFLPSFDDPARLFRQEADHTFTEVTVQAGIIHSDQCVQAVFFDFDLDGDPDIFVSRGEGFANRLFVNRGDGTFADEASTRHIDDPDPHGQGLTVADYDGDGDLDIYMSNANGGNRLYRNEGGQFSEVAEAAGVRDGGRSLGCMFADLDNDGWPDLYVGNFGQNRVFRNQGDGTFADESANSGADDGNRAYGTSTIDYDGDGRLDIFFCNSGQLSKLLHNLGPVQHWLNLVLTGQHSNRNGIGARVVVTSGGKRQTQQLLAGSSMVSGGNDLSFHFGLGASAQAERIEVFWPSGERDVLQNQAGGHTIKVVEGSYGVPPSDTTAPHLAEIIVETISSNSAIISWLTDEPGTAWIEYGVTQAYGSQVEGQQGLNLNHVVRLTNLQAETRYHFRVHSQDAAGNEAVSPNNIFLTEPLVLPYIIQDLSVQNVTGHSAEITWRTSGRTICAVAYGTTKNYGTTASAISADNLFHHAEIQNLKSSTAYHMQIIARYNKNEAVYSRDFTLTTLFEPDTLPPLISNVVVRAVTYQSASLAWDTDEAASSQLEYGTDTGYGHFSPLDTAAMRHHEIVLTPLAANTGYHFRILARDAAGNASISPDFTFQTLPEPDTRPPALANIAAQEIAAHAVKIVWDTDEAATAQVEYGLSTGYGQTTGRDDLQSHHEIGLQALTANTVYHFRVHSRDAAGNPAVSNDLSFQTLPEADTTPPQLANIEARNVATNRATIVWDTDEAATAQVEYGLSTGYGQTTGRDDLQSHHEIALQALAASTVYHFRVHSRDAAGNPAVSNDLSFQTLPEADTTPPQLANIEARNVTTNRATIVWDTDENATARVEYGTDTNYGETLQDNSLQRHHEMELAGLSSNTTYHFRILSRDGAGNLATSGDFNFTTERSGGGNTYTITDDFNRSDLGSDWTRDDRFWEIHNGEFGHTSQATGSWRYLAVFNRVRNGNGSRITEVSYRWGQNVDEIGVREGAMALMLDQDSPHASGYWIWHRYNQVWLWTIVNGEYVNGVDLGHWNGSGDPVAGDIVSVVIREENDANYFDYYINGRYSATAVDPAKRFPRSQTWYTGVFMRGEGVHNDCDDFSVTYVQGSAAAPALSLARTAAADSTKDAALALTPQSFALSNYPNPLFAGASTRVRMLLPTAAELQLTIFDVLGRAVKQLAAGEYPAGMHELAWRGDDQTGARVAQGVYILRCRYRRVQDFNWSQLTQRVSVFP